MQGAGTRRTSALTVTHECLQAVRAEQGTRDGYSEPAGWQAHRHAYCPIIQSPPAPPLRQPTCCAGSSDIWGRLQLMACRASSQALVGLRPSLLRSAASSVRRAHCANLTVDTTAGQSLSRNLCLTCRLGKQAGQGGERWG